MKKLNDILSQIKPVSADLDEAIQAHINDLTKPPGSLGRLEEFALQYCRIRQSAKPGLPKKKIFTFAADHGVAAEGVSAFPQEVTHLMVSNMAAGGAAINVFARHGTIEHAIVDIGVKGKVDAPGVIGVKVAEGSANMAQGPAMSEPEALQAVVTGYELACVAADEGYELLGTGEMGIANTTPSAALMSVLLPASVEDSTGRGTGVDDAGLKHKINVIQKAIEVNGELLKDAPSHPFEALRAVGGLEIAAICGLILGAASRHVPVVVDGFISSAAALVACRMSPHVRDYLFFSHASAENGYRIFMEKFDVKPIFDLGMRLGEGTGAALAINLIEASLKMYNEMATFSSAGIAPE